MRQLTALLVLLILALASIGCSVNMDTLPAQVALLTAAVAVVEPDVCRQIPYDDAKVAAEAFIDALKVAESGCPPLPAEPLE